MCQDPSNTVFVILVCPKVPCPLKCVDIILHCCIKYYRCRSLATFITQAPKKENKVMLLITVTSWLNKMDCNPRPTLGSPKCNNDSLTLSLYGDREKAAPCQWSKSITSRHLEGHAKYTAIALSMSVCRFCYCLRVR